MSIDYLLIFDGGAYRTDPADFAAGIESEFPSGLVRRPLPDPEETGAFFQWKYGLGDAEVTGRTSANGDAVFVHARDTEMAGFTRWVRRIVPPEVEVVLTNTSYSFTSVIPNDATEAEISELIE
jgi:hypothetical protein